MESLINTAKDTRAVDSAEARLVSLGFATEQSRKASVAGGGNLDASLDWLASQEQYAAALYETHRCSSLSRSASWQACALPAAPAAQPWPS